MKVLAASLVVAVVLTLGLAQQQEEQSSGPRETVHEPNYKTEKQYYSRQTYRYDGGPGYDGHSGGPGYDGHSGGPGYDGHSGGPGYDGHSGGPGYDGHSGGPGYDGHSGGPGYGGHSGGPGYGRHSGGPGYGGYGSRSSHRARVGYGFGSLYGGYGAPDTPLDELDDLHNRVKINQANIKSAEEIVGSLEARLSLQKKILDKFLTETLPETRKTNTNQNNALDRLDSQLDDIENQLNNLENQIMQIEMINNNVLPDQESADKDLAEERREDIGQDGSIASLSASAKDLKEKLLSVMGNAFMTPDDAIGHGDDVFDLLVKPTENSRMCEVGRLTLDSDGRRAEYLFQTNFAYVPFLLYSVCGFNFDLDAKDNYNSYGGYHKEPNRLGVMVSGSVVSTTGVTFELTERSFGDTATKTVDVCFQACSIGPQSTLRSNGHTSGTLPF